MTIRLVAVMELDGSAFVESEGHLYFVQPPYKSKQRIRATQTDVERAVLHLGFRVADEQFQSWASLIKHLNTLTHDARLKSGQDLHEMDLAVRVMDSAPPEVITKFLDRIEQELLPNMDLESAQNILIAMLKSDNAMQRLQ